MWRGVKIARECKDAFGMLLASGITSMLAFHLLVNVGMTMGVMPVTGIPLPLMSYGVSSLLTNVTCLGLLMNIHNEATKFTLLIFSRKINFHYSF